jgi:hypothetical protein
MGISNHVPFGQGQQQLGPLSRHEGSKDRSHYIAHATFPALLNRLAAGSIRRPARAGPAPPKWGDVFSGLPTPSLPTTQARVRDRWSHIRSWHCPRGQARQGITELGALGTALLGVAVPFPACARLPPLGGKTLGPESTLTAARCFSAPSPWSFGQVQGSEPPAGSLNCRRSAPGLNPTGYRDYHFDTVRLSPDNGLTSQPNSSARNLRRSSSLQSARHESHAGNDCDAFGSARSMARTAIGKP